MCAFYLVVAQMDQFPPQVQGLVRQLKAAGVPIDEDDPEQIVQILRQMQRKKEPEIVKKEDALPGRDTTMKISDKHYVLGTPMRGPWPQGFQICVFANGCFWGSEKGIWRLPGGGVHSTAVGYAAGFTPNPT